MFFLPRALLRIRGLSDAGTLHFLAMIQAFFSSFSLPQRYRFVAFVSFQMAWQLLYIFNTSIEGHASSRDSIRILYSWRKGLKQVLGSSNPCQSVVKNSTDVKLGTLQPRRSMSNVSLVPHECFGKSTVASTALCPFRKCNFLTAKF